MTPTPQQLTALRAQLEEALGLADAHPHEHTGLEVELVTAISVAIDVIDGRGDEVLDDDSPVTGTGYLAELSTECAGLTEEQRRRADDYLQGALLVLLASRDTSPSSVRGAISRAGLYGRSIDRGVA